jgi:hypothetical protein
MVILSTQHIRGFSARDDLRAGTGKGKRRDSLKNKARPFLTLPLR